ncbi:DNA mismatch repair protein MutS, core,DNA mismatch repair protein MutS, C-terminal,P-loop containing [Cinara cedri]|uniref:DNA mismatch repair protein MutS, core,DNA mismatch repair protein MutS, C-terminal,P-loop containing n=1 Tax=Cinara cedri TaxID=506608 RepID=A0A5E4MKM9_9HEMI|nr:DNA mismatch repair protein MutS, core,DNA mismatch repair protein MutS, C-terminal,P-loop containing [Cinara cedri]
MLGAASYNRHQSQIHILYDAMESNLDYKILNTLFMQIKPVHIVVCNLINGTFLKIIKQLAYDGKINMYANSSTTVNSILDEKIHVLPKWCFKFKTCEQLILSMPLASAPKNKESRIRYIRSLVDFTQELAVCALGALLYFMDNSLERLNLPSNFTILSLRILNMNDLVWLGISTYESLQIFSAHEHPSANNWIVKSNKDNGLSSSIFSLLNRCNSVFSSEYLKNILAQPTKNLDVLRYRHESIMVKLNGGNASIYQWKSLYQSVLNAIKIGEICGRYCEEINLFRKINNSLKGSLYNMASSMTRIIDFEQSTKQDKFIVNTGVLPELDEKKLKIKNMSHVLDVMTLIELQDLPSHIQECSICKWPELGFFLCIPIWKHSSEMTENDYKIQNLEFKFQMANDVYYKTSRCYELDKFFGEIEYGIIKEETQTMIKLTELITQYWISDLHAILYLISELDCLIGFAEVAQDLTLIKPKMLPKEKCMIHIVNGRHILQEQYVNKFIPNNYNSSKMNQTIKILTGFNSTGKSVYLKQVALISYLCHIGCYVPAEYVEISVLDHIHTRIQSTESVSTLMSAFMIDLKQMSVAVNESTCGSLIILDEFGKGTSELNGLALLLASISHFVHRPLHLLPHIIVSTHFYSLPNLLQQIINTNILYHNIKFLSMSYEIVNSELVSSYMVVDKKINQNLSMAHHIAALNGLPTTIVQRATQVLQSVQNNEYVNPMVENLRFELLLRRKQYIGNLLEHIQVDGITEGIFQDLVDDLENIRYPQKY